MAEWDAPGYTKLRELGSGGFGEVVLARHDASGTLVAIKYLRPHLLADAEFAEMFRGEASVLSTLDDPNVVRLYEYLESPSGAAIVMELVDGVSLREILRTRARPPRRPRWWSCRARCSDWPRRTGAVSCTGTTSRRTCWSTGDGASKLTDFGIAARAGDRPAPAGTLVYAPPEQFAGTPASPASDVYAATATFYECLVGRPPFIADTAEALLYQHLSQPVPLDPVPEPLRPLVIAGMAKEPRGPPGRRDQLRHRPQLDRGRRIRPGLGGTRPVAPGRSGAAAGAVVAVGRISRGPGPRRGAHQPVSRVPVVSGSAASSAAGDAGKPGISGTSGTYGTSGIFSTSGIAEVHGIPGAGGSARPRPPSWPARRSWSWRPPRRWRSA